jgi:hypothetical protein
MVIKMCLNYTHNKFHIGEHMSEAFPVQNGLKQGDMYHPYFSVLGIE